MEDASHIEVPSECYDCGGQVVAKSEHGIGWRECSRCRRAYALGRGPELVERLQAAKEGRDYLHDTGSEFDVVSPRRGKSPSWRRIVTLCIAAVCYHHGEPRIVISSDWKQESGFTSAENQDKLFWVRDDWPVLVAGTMARAVYLKDTYRTYLDSNKEQLSKILRSQVLDVLREPLKLFKHKLADEFIGSRLGISYDAFLCSGKAQLPEALVTDLLTVIRRISLDCQLLFPLFVSGDPFLFRIIEETVEPCDNFAAIGTGTEMAESTLCQRKQDEGCSLSKTLYHIFEAGKLASLAPPPGVGKEHTIGIFYPPRKIGESPALQELTNAGYRFLEKKYKEFGPKAVKPFTFDEKYLEDVEFGD